MMIKNEKDVVLVRALKKKNHNKGDVELTLSQKKIV